ncbi:MAG: dihydroorotate dehydrogenase [Patescibacteria group bacterium]|nr:dihydroorotate dehydrogenase [Patescibacteria group bacterium]
MLYRKMIAPIIFALTEDDPEKAHELAIRVMTRVQNVPLLLQLIALWYRANENPNPVKVAGIPFPNPIGLAAGFDKHAEILLFLQALDFGFIEVGTALPCPQDGNPRPRQFRIPEDGAIINRNGFNSHGCAAVAERLKDVHPDLHIPLGISCGKMKDTPLEKAAEDYATVASQIGTFGAYIAINVSSPNTPELRRLQGREYLENIVCSVVLQSAGKPVFVKISPDLTEEELDITLEAIIHGGGKGIIIGNTTTARPSRGTGIFRRQPSRTYGESGGLSGPLLEERVLPLIKRSRTLEPKLPIIGVGGTYDRDSAQRKFDAGANLVQLFTGLVYRGPGLITECRNVEI